MDDIISLGCGILGFCFSEVLDFTLRELALMKEAREKVDYNKERGEWERSRWMAALIMQPHLKKRLSPQDICRFPWEKQANVEKIKWLKQAMEGDKRFPDKI